MQQKKQAIFIADLGFGDAGKGTITDFLTERHSAHTIVRYNGGPQAAHTVVTGDGRHHTFAQFSSGTFHPGTTTLLSRFMLVNPLNMLKEDRHLKACGVIDALQHTQIDRRALIITPFQRAINRLREITRAANRHGSCGEGIGECMADSLQYGNAMLFVGDTQDRVTLIKKLHVIRDIKRCELEELKPHLPQIEAVQRECTPFTDPETIAICADIYSFFSECIEIVDEAAIRSIFAKAGTILFEGAQGVLLDENYGFTPYTTWSTTTFANAETLMHEHAYTGDVIKLGVLRTYATRHGAGPFPTEEPALTSLLPEQHNRWNHWQQKFRVGYCDLVAARYAKNVIGPLDFLALTHTDRLKVLPRENICTAYRYHGEQQDLHSYFEHTGATIQNIKVYQPANLTHQAQLTQRLLSCSPEYQMLPPQSNRLITSTGRAAYSSFIAEQLSTPIGILSYGPTAADKHCSSNFMQASSQMHSAPGR